MTAEQRKSAILELANELSAKDIRDVENDLDDLGDERAKQECEVNGHQIDNDHCGRPEHRFCRHCYTQETEINQAREAKVDEAADSKSVQPSASLGSGSTSVFSRIKGLFVCTLFVLFVSVVTHAQATDCPPDKVCLTQEQAAKYLTLEDTVKAQEKEILSLKGAVLDQKLVTVDAKIALAEKSGENTALKQQIVDLRADNQFLLTNGRKKCAPFSFCIQ